MDPALPATGGLVRRDVKISMNARGVMACVTFFPLVPTPPEVAPVVPVQLDSMVMVTLVVRRRMRDPRQRVPRI